MSRQRLVALTTLAVLVLGTAGVARGFFTTIGGSGSGTLAVPPLTGVAVSPATVASGLRPGGTATLAVVAANANPQPVRIGSLRLAAAVSADSPACVDPAISVAPQTNAGAGWAIPAGGSLTITIPGAIAMGPGADSGCQGATLTVPLLAGE